MRLIGLGGFKRSGKDTIGRIIKENRDDVLLCAFAYPLKVMAARAIGVEGTADECVGWCDEFKKDGLLTWVTSRHEEQFRTITGRSYLQNFGNRAREVFGDSFWIDQVLPNPYTEEWPAALLPNLYPDTEILVVTDVRYPNEAERVRLLGGEVWEVIRPGAESDGHATEQKLAEDLVDHQVFNYDTLDELKSQVLELC